MDIGVPYRDLGPVPVAPLVEQVNGLPEAAWHRHSIREDVLADKVHAVAQTIVLRHEYHAGMNTVGYHHLEDLLYAWSLEKGVPPHEVAPIGRLDIDIGSVYVLPAWREFAATAGPVVEAVHRLLGGRGVVTRVALVRLNPGARIPPHIDNQPIAARAHRVHVPLAHPSGVEYKIDGRKLVMAPGRAYDFNNRRRHSVRHNGRRPRVNLFVDVYPEARPAVANPLRSNQPLYVGRAPDWTEAA